MREEYFMPVPHLKETLHQLIETADDFKLEAINTLLQAEENSAPSYSVNELEAIYERRNNFLLGKEQGFSVQEFIKYVKQN